MGKSGVDQLTRTLNEYLGALVEGILGSDGDILKFAGIVELCKKKCKSGNRCRDIKYPVAMANRSYRKLCIFTERKYIDLYDMYI